MTLDQAIKLLDAAGPGSEHRLAAYVVVSLLAGIRTEEARALMWAEVDLKAGTVAVYRSVRAKGDTKTRKSRRILKLPTKAVEALKEHRKRQAAEQLQAGERLARSRARLLPRGRHPAGQLARAPRVRRDHQGGRAGGGLDTKRTAALFVSILSASATRIEDISDLMGHSGTRLPIRLPLRDRPALTTGATAMNKILSKKRARTA